MKFYKLLNPRRLYISTNINFLFIFIDVETVELVAGDMQGGVFF